MHRFGPAVSLTAKSLQVGGGKAIYACHGEGLSELDGQLLLGLGRGRGRIPRRSSPAAEAAEAAGRHDAAAALFGRCLAIDPGDAVAAFNRANCLRAAGRPAEAEAELARALKLDPGFVEAWFNLAGLVAARGRVGGGARGISSGRWRSTPAMPTRSSTSPRSSSRPGDFAAARRWWERYLELDATSDWARTGGARRCSFVALQAQRLRRLR